MRKKRVWRYYCDHCKKAGCSAGHMARHEKHCCANPDRVCRMCALDKAEPNEQKPMAELLAAYELSGLSKLREVAGGCPACMLAAIIIWRKQNDVEKWSEEGWCGDFDFKKEKDTWFADRIERGDYY